MQTARSRREVLAATGGALLLAPLGLRAQPPETPGAAAAGGVWPHFPHDDPRLIAEVVGKSHSDEARVKELVTAHPHLTNAWWDWGFGDWESALGAAAHTGRRGIAEFLIDRGARIDIFAAAMLGYTDVVRAFVSVRPGIQRQLGPHGIPLLNHARAGGAPAKETLDYLVSLGDAGNAPASKPISPEEQRRFVGAYSLDGAKFEIRVNPNKLLVFAMAGESDRVLHWLGGGKFFPAGVPTTRLEFDLAATPVTVTITAGPYVRRGVKQ